MYIPKHFADIDNDEVVQFIRQYSFGVIVTAKDNIPVATHLPFVVSADNGSITLSSHFAKANHQWQDIAESNVLVIFSEPHAYVSPKHYESELSVPTWNYIAVHAHGRCELVTDETEVFHLLEAMINTYETDYMGQWASLPLEYKEKMSKGIVAFRITVDDISAINKLSQNKKEIERQRIIAHLGDSDDGNERTIAHLMAQNEDKIKRAERR